MRTRRLYVLLTVVIVVMGLLFAAFRSPPEPSYGGKKLSEWLDRYRVSSSEVDAAVRQIGPSAVPWLLKWMRCEQPARWKERLYTPLHRVPIVRRGARRVLGIERWERSEWAMFALRALGSEGTHATMLSDDRLLLEELTRLLNDPRRPATAVRAAGALGTIGTTGFAPLTAVATNRQLPAVVRFAATENLVFSSNGQAVVRSFLTNSDPLVRALASNSLARTVPGGIQ